jgi:hypothetical protein
MRPSGSDGAGAFAALALLDDVHRYRLRRADQRSIPAGMLLGNQVIPQTMQRILLTGDQVMGQTAIIFGACQEL